MPLSAYLEGAFWSQGFQPHRLHLFQRLNQAGWPHAQVSLLYVAATAALALAILAGGWPWVFGLAVLELLLGVGWTSMLRCLCSGVEELMLPPSFQTC